MIKNNLVSGLCFITFKKSDKILVIFYCGPAFSQKKIWNRRRNRDLYQIKLFLVVNETL